MFKVDNYGSNLFLIELTFSLNTLVEIIPVSFQTSISLDGGKCDLWPASLAALEREISVFAFLIDRGS